MYADFKQNRNFKKCPSQPLHCPRLSLGSELIWLCCLATLFLENRVPEDLWQTSAGLGIAAKKFSSALLPGASHAGWGYDAWNLRSVPPQGLDGAGQQEDGELWVVTWAHIQQLPSLSSLWKVALAFHCLPSGDNDPLSLAGLLGGLDEIMPASPQGRAWHNHA